MHSNSLEKSFDLTGKTAVVCGASQGIGEAAARLLAFRGARILALSRNTDKLGELISSLWGNDRGHRYLAVDLSSTEELRAVLKEIAGERPQILVNNSGGPKGGLLIDASIEEFDEPLRAHLKAAHMLTQACVPHMKAASYGRVINVISTSVKVPIPGLGVSNTVRGAMANWSKTLAGELGPYGITVNNVLPGYIRTGRFDSLVSGTASRMKIDSGEVEEQWKQTIPLRRIGEPEEMAEAIAFLASPAASYINGINLPVDGGRTPSL